MKKGTSLRFRKGHVCFAEPKRGSAKFIARCKHCDGMLMRFPGNGILEKDGVWAHPTAVEFTDMIADGISWSRTCIAAHQRRT